MIETLRNIDVTDIDKMINEITGPTCSSIGYIKSKKGEHIIEKKNASMMKWIHYIDDDRVKHTIYKNIKGPVIAKSVLINMNRNKAAGKVGIVTKML